MSEDVAQRRLRSLPQSAGNGVGGLALVGGSHPVINSSNTHSSSPSHHLTPYPLPALRRHKPPRHPKNWMGRPYARGQCYPLLVDSCNNHTTDEESVGLLLGDSGDEGSAQRHTARFFAFCFILLFLLLLLYLPVYHQVQVREGGLWALQFGGMWRSTKAVPQSAARKVKYLLHLYTRSFSSYIFNLHLSLLLLLLLLLLFVAATAAD
ncbi:hypothetical protein B566_EDAN007611 [Ephemera danica]|nr:hypothetical protein B566_EDAN007611 [Ephemera danica]